MTCDHYRGPAGAGRSPDRAVAGWLSSGGVRDRGPSSCSGAISCSWRLPSCWRPRLGPRVAELARGAHPPGAHGPLLDRLLDILEETRAAQELPDPDALTREIDTLAADVVRHTGERATDTRTFGSLTLAVDGVLSAVAEACRRV